MNFGHRHQYEAVAVEHRPATVVIGPRPPLTIVLWRCRCRDVRTQELAGCWTLSQVRGERELTAEERAGIDALVAAER